LSTRAVCDQSDGLREEVASVHLYGADEEVNPEIDLPEVDKPPSAWFLDEGGWEPPALQIALGNRAHDFHAVLGSDRAPYCGSRTSWSGSPDMAPCSAPM
jgi:hypothetical protein